MNKIMALFFVNILFSCAVFTLPCPTCVGRLENNSPTFFSEELYQSSEDENRYEEADFNPCHGCEQEAYDCKACGGEKQEIRKEKS